MARIKITTEEAVIELKKLITELSTLKETASKVGLKSASSLKEIENQLKNIKKASLKTRESFDVINKSVKQQSNNSIKLEENAKKENTQKIRAKKLTIEERVENQALNKIKRQQAREQLGLVDAYEKLSIKRKKAERILANLLSVENKNIKQIKIAQREYNKLNDRVQKVDVSTKNFYKNIVSYRSAIGGLAGTFRSLASALGFAGGIYLFATSLRKSFNIVRDFDKSMQNLAGIFRTTRDELAPLEKKIIDVSSVSTKTSTEVANLAQSLATLGKSSSQIETLLGPTVDLGIALGTTSGEAGEFLIQMLNAFGGSESEALKYAETIATIRTSTSLDFQRMRDSFSYVASISKILNIDLAYTGALVGILSDNGIKAQSSGRLLATSQQRLASQGITLNDALDKINDAQERGVKETDLLKVATSLFGIEAAKIGIILANNSDIIEKNAQAIRDNEGALDDLVNQQLESLDAKIKILEASWEKFILGVDNGTGVISKFFKGSIELLTAFLDGLSSADKTLNEMLKSNEVDSYTASLELLNAEVKNLSESSREVALNYALDTATKKLSENEQAMEKVNKKRERLLEIEKQLEKSGSELNILKRIPLEREQKNLQDELKQLEINEKANAILQGEIKAINELLEKKDEQSKKTIEQSRSVSFLKNEISKLKKEQEGLTNSDISQSIAINNKVKAYQKEIDAILQVSKKTPNIKFGEVNTGQLDLEIVKLKKNINQLENLVQTKDITNDKIIQKTSEIFAKKTELINKEYELQLKLSKDNAIKENIAKEQQSQKEEELLFNHSNRIEELKEEFFHNELKELRSNNRALLNEKTILLNNEYKKIKVPSIEQEKKYQDELSNLKIEYANRELQIQAERIKEQLKNVEIQGQARVDLERNVLDLLSKLKIEKKSDGGKNEELNDYLNITRDVSGKIGDIFDSQSRRRIENINAEINAETEKYDKLIALAEDDASRKGALEKQKQDKIAILEKKREKEEHKQAKKRQKFAVAEVAINTAISVSKVWGQTGIFGAIAQIAPIAMGALQTAIILSQPIPQYKDGVDDLSQDEEAMINDGGQKEYVERDGQILSTDTKNAIVQLKKGDTVYKNKRQMINESQIYATTNNLVNKIPVIKYNISDDISKQIKKGFRDVKIKNTVNIMNQRSNDYLISKARLNG